jgi:hypothetical protein
MHGSAAWMVGCLVFVATACERTASEDERGAQLAEATVGGRIVSTVNGEPIAVDDVARVARETGLGAEAALRLLQDQALLAREAERRGLAAHPDVRDAARRAAVQALLAREVEGAEPAAADDDAQVRLQHARLVGLVQRLEGEHRVERRPEHFAAAGMAEGPAHGEP